TTTTTTTTSTDTSASEIIASKKGDVTCDGTVKIDDVVLLCRYVAEDPKIEITVQGIANGDCDGIKGVSADDAIIVLKYLAGIVETL
ncbi:MAG: hypothetical protein IKM30_07800, partial [Oscillospiraceae bacterium]|nr:hypothetical protein [Oscillospiraceae bacterium]